MQIPPFAAEVLENHPLVLLDAGARGGIKELKRLAPWVHAFGFEPHPAAYGELPAATGPYCRQHYLPWALGAERGVQTLNLASHPSYSSFLKVDWAVHRRHLSLMPHYRQWAAELAQVGKAEVGVTTLDEASAELGLQHIGLLKLDTQGTELDILSGATGLLENKRVALIKCEVSFIPFYKGQCLFADIAHFLEAYGYSFVDCLFYPEVENLRPGIGKKTASPISGIAESPHFSMGGDAIFYQPSPENAVDALKTGILLAELGYFSPAFEVLTRYANRKNNEVASLLRALAWRPARQRLKEELKRWLPPVVIGWLRN